MAYLVDVDQLFNKPRTELEEFIKRPVDEKYIDEFALVYGRLWTRKAQYESDLAKIKNDVYNYTLDKQYELSVELDPRSHEDSKKWKRYSLESIIRSVEREPHIRRLRIREIELERKINILKGYLKMMDTKSRTMPGEQGRQNAYFRAEGKHSI